MRPEEFDVHRRSAWWAAQTTLRAAEPSELHLGLELALAFAEEERIPPERSGPLALGAAAALCAVEHGHPFAPLFRALLVTLVANERGSAVRRPN